MAGRYPCVPACSPKKCIISHSYHSVLLEFCVHVKSTVEFFLYSGHFHTCMASWTWPDRSASEDKHVESDIEHLPKLQFFPYFKTLLFCCLSLNLQDSHTLSWEVVTHSCFTDDLATFSPFTAISTTTWQLTEGFKGCVRSLSLLKQTSWCCCCLRTPLTVQTQWRTRRFNNQNKCRRVEWYFCFSGCRWWWVFDFCQKGTFRLRAFQINYS